MKPQKDDITKVELTTAEFDRLVAAGKDRIRLRDKANGRNRIYIEDVAVSTRTAFIGGLVIATQAFGFGTLWFQVDDALGDRWNMHCELEADRLRSRKSSDYPTLTLQEMQIIRERVMGK